MQKILIVEDEKELATILASYLKVEGFEAITAFDGQEGLECFQKDNADLILLDIMLPKLDGMELCKRIRENSQVPIIMISAKSGEMDKVIALGIGADDYVTKPFSPLELVARVKAQLRRAQTFQKETKENNDKLYGRLYLDKQSYIAKVDQTVLVLTTKEFEVLHYLAYNEGIVLSKEQIYENVWDSHGIIDENTVVVYINRLRDKLKKYNIDYIKTIWGAGYKFISKEMD